MQISAIKPYTTPETYKKIYTPGKFKEIPENEKTESTPNFKLADIHYNGIFVKQKELNRFPYSAGLYVESKRLTNTD